mmetsp:Transcript_290/g.924  ORF Transcript_290/g.924 Transcript_290/m.924 type:complete len:101 (+) Transcript_290:2-304(+)
MDGCKDLSTCVYDMTDGLTDTCVEWLGCVLAVGVTVSVRVYSPPSLSHFLVAYRDRPSVCLSCVATMMDRWMDAPYARPPVCLSVCLCVCRSGGPMCVCV